MAVTTTIPPGARSSSPCSGKFFFYITPDTFLSITIFIIHKNWIKNKNQNFLHDNHFIKQKNILSFFSYIAASGPPPANRCCDSGRPLFTDPTTGQTICSCQHEQMLNYQRIAQASLMGPGGMPLSMYNSAAYADGLPAAAYMPGVGPEQFHYVS